MIQTKDLFTTDEMTKSTRSLHTPGNFAKQNLLYVQEVGHLQSLQPHRCIREKLDSFLFMMVLEGQGSLELQGRKIEISKGDCAFIDCMEHYEHISDEEEGWKLAWVHFNGHSARGYYEQFLKFNGNSHAFHVKDVKTWFASIEKLLELQKDKSVMAELYSGEELVHLLNAIMDTVAGSAIVESKKDKQIAENARELINEKYQDTAIMTAIAETLGKDITKVGEIFQKTYGITLEEYIGNRRYNSAKEMLRFTVKPIDVVAKESGIGDVIAMQDMFRSRDGMTVEEYRQKWAGWIRS